MDLPHILPELELVVCLAACRCSHVPKGRSRQLEWIVCVQAGLYSHGGINVPPHHTLPWGGWVGRPGALSFPPGIYEDGCRRIVPHKTETLDLPTLLVLLLAVFRGAHDWSSCPYAHPKEKARRRDARVYKYASTPCPESLQGINCGRGVDCPYAHSVYEVSADRFAGYALAFAIAAVHACVGGD